MSFLVGMLERTPMEDIPMHYTKEPGLLALEASSKKKKKKKKRVPGPDAALGQV